MDRRRSHLMYDIRILMDEWSSELQYIYSTWNSTSVSGRPLVVLIVAKNMLEAVRFYFLLMPSDLGSSNYMYIFFNVEMSGGGVV